MYPKELTSNKSNINSNYWPFLDFDIFTPGTLHKIYDKRDDVSFPMVIVSLLTVGVLLAPSNFVFISYIVAMLVSVVMFWISMSVNSYERYQDYNLIRQMRVSST